MKMLLESLVISPTPWQTTLPGLMVDRGVFAMGEMRVNLTKNEADISEREYLVSSLRRLPRFPSGRDEPPLCDRVLVIAAENGEPMDLVQLSRRLQPLPSQCWIVLVLGLGRDGDGWAGAIIERGVPRPLLHWRVVGPGMFAFSRGANDENEEPDVESAERWSRTRKALGADVVEKLRNAAIAVIGAGRNGTELSWELASMGFKTMVIVDNDPMEIGNLDAMPGHLVEDARCGKNKAIALAERLAAFRGDDLIVKALPCSVTENRVVEALRGVDVICTAVDNDTPRLGGSIIANRYLKVHCDVASGVTINAQGERMWAGDARIFLPNQGCVACAPGLPNEAEARHELFAPPGALRPPKRAWDEEPGRAGSLLPINAATVSTAVMSLLDLFSGKLTGSVWHRLRWNEGSSLQVDHSLVSRREGCEICRPAR